MWKYVCCEVQGIGHSKSDTPCQDKTFALTQNGVHVIALADGAGSAKLSHYGAERVVQAAASFIGEHFQECYDNEDGRKVKQNLLEVIQKNLLKEAEALGCDIHDLASTLLLVAVSGDNLLMAHIGDGVIGYLEGDKLKVASMPDNGEFSNETTFVTSKSALLSMRLIKGRLENRDGFVLMSDGTAQSLYHKLSKTLAYIIVRLMHRTCLISAEVMKMQLENALTHVIATRTHDDCSIAILARPSELLAPLEKLSAKERQDLFEIPALRPGRRRFVKRYDRMLEFCGIPCPLKRIAKGIHLKPKYAQRYANRLVSLGLLTKRDSLYQRV